MASLKLSEVTMVRKFLLKNLKNLLFQFPTCDKQPVIFAEQWASREDGTDCEKMTQKSDKPYLAIMSYWATPHTWCNLSPAELLMGRMMITIPQMKESLMPNYPYFSQFREDK